MKSILLPTKEATASKYVFNMATNKEVLAKGVKYLFGALPMMFIGPVIFYNSLMNKHTDWHYLVLVIACLICIASVILAFIGLNLMVKALFDGDK